MIENSRKGYLIFAEVFFCLFVFMKQFYLFPSGFIGIGDVFLVISAIIVFVVQIFIEKEKFLYTIDFYWYIFIGFVVLINGFYFFKTKNIDFLKYRARCQPWFRSYRAARSSRSSRCRESY